MLHIMVLFIYLIIAAVFTYPLVFRMQEILLGWPLDAYNYLWNIDTFWYELASGRNPFFTHKIFFPFGTGLIFHTYAPFISVLSFFFLNSKEWFLNLLVLISPAVSAFTAYILVNQITGKKLPSILSGFIYGFSPILFSFILSQHYYFAFAASTLPLAVLFIKNYFESGKIRNVAYLFLSFWICFFIDYYTAVLYAFLVTVYFLLELVKNPLIVRSRLLENKYALINTTMVTFVAPFFILVIFITLTSPVFTFLNQQTGYAEFCSASIIRFFIPSELNPILPKLAGYLNSTFKLDVNYDTPSYFVGFTTLLIAFSSTLLYRKKELFTFIGIGIFIFLFSLGNQTGVFYNTITKLPFLGLIDCPQRFTIGFQLILAILAGMALSAISTRKINNFLLMFLVPLIILEYATFNIPYTHLEIPPIYKTLAAYPDNRTLLEIPGGIADSKYAYGYDWSYDALLLKQLYWQSVHHKNKVGGYTSRLPESYYETYKNEPVLSMLFNMTSVDMEWEPAYYLPDVVDNFINKFNLGYILLSPHQNQAIFVSYLEMVFKDKIKEVVFDGDFILIILK